MDADGAEGTVKGKVNAPPAVGECVISSTYPFCGKLLKIEVAQVVLPNGVESQREMVVHRGAAAIVAIDRRMVLLERQFRLTAGKALWELPAGTIEASESPEECARRELREETGYEAESWTKMTQFYVAPGYSKEVIHIFRASGLRKSKGSPDRDELIEPIFVDFRKALEMVFNNTIEDSKTIIGLLLTSLELEGSAHP